MQCKIMWFILVRIWSQEFRCQPGYGDGQQGFQIKHCPAQGPGSPAEC